MAQRLRACLLRSNYQCMRILMRRAIRLIGAACFACSLSLAEADAASLSVSPIRVEVLQPATSGNVTLRNESGRPLVGQVRVFEWALRDGKDHFTPTDQVIASPPIVQLAPGSDALVRLLRLTGAPVDGEKAYRLVIDEVPNANRVRNMGVNLAVRYALPLFFVNPDASQSKLVWTIENRSGRKVLVSVNSGDRSVRISDLAIGGVKIAPGLAGYVLGRSERVFELPRNAPNAGAISAETDKGRLNAQVGR
jgi:fimbrial chaperone protein